MTEQVPERTWKSDDHSFHWAEVELLSSASGTF